MKILTLVLTAAAVLLLVICFGAQAGMKVVGGATGVSNTAVALTSSIRSDAVGGQFFMLGDAIRWRADGTDPTATEGIPFGPPGGYEFKCKDEIDNFRAILQSGGSGATIYWLLWYND